MRDGFAESPRGDVAVVRVLLAQRVLGCHHAGVHVTEAVGKRPRIVRQPVLGQVGDDADLALQRKQKAVGRQQVGRALRLDVTGVALIAPC